MGEEIFEGKPGRALDERLDRVVGVALAELSEFAPERSQRVIERAGALGAPTDLEVEQQRHDRSLEVVRDGGIHRVLVGAIELDPRIEARLFEALAQASRDGGQPGQLLAELLQIALRRLETGATESEPIVVAGPALHDPQRARVGLALVIERPERVGVDALYVPEMEELVRDELEEILVFVGGLEGEGAGENGR